ncbi:hypothetical protein PQR14_14155 [Paraburkholderia bryophila]|uniref:hypothetical protein n=1 Tax=Burkholderiaceae TaxID=119060 RepID=UPI0012E0AA34|nr:hypothetical protein [Burkholderia sp. 9120]
MHTTREWECASAAAGTKAAAVAASSIKDISLRTTPPVQRAVILKRHRRFVLCSTQEDQRPVKARALKPMPRAAQRMPPVDAPRFNVRGSHLVQMAVFLPQFVGEKKRDDKQRNHQKNAQNQVLDHGGLRSQEQDFIVEHRMCPNGVAPRINTRQATCDNATPRPRQTRAPPRFAAWIGRTALARFTNSRLRALTN